MYIHTYMYTYIHVYIYIYIHIFGEYRDARKVHLRDKGAGCDLLVARAVERQREI